MDRRSLVKGAGAAGAAVVAGMLAACGKKEDAPAPAAAPASPAAPAVHAGETVRWRLAEGDFEQVRARIEAVQFNPEVPQP